MDEHQALLETATAALRQVVDPELGVNVVDLGLVAGVEEDRGLLKVRYRLTSAACPVGGMMAAGMHDAVAMLPGVSNVVMELIEDPPWSVDLVTPEGRALLGW
jgi:metal-sulfur cluster biosynthetic enzyme